MRINSGFSTKTSQLPARMNREEGDGAWCPAGPLVPSDVQFLQLDLQQLTFLTIIGTQGRHARGTGNEFARMYRLDYSRDGLVWMSWKNRFGNKVRPFIPVSSYVYTATF